MFTGETITYGYTSLGQASYYREKSGSATNLYESYSYNKYGDLSGKSLAYGVSQSYSYGYSADSRRYCNSISFGNVTVQLDMDSYNRPTQKRVLTGGTQLVRKEYSYLETNNKRTDRLTEIKGYVKGVLKQREQYGYDSTSAALKTITYPLKNKQITYSYYTTTGEMNSEVNGLLGKTLYRSFDDEGNITSNNINGTKLYTYSGDKLTKYGTETFVYDNMGNPTTYRSKPATWKGRQLTSYNGNTFTYDGRGRRAGKNSLTFLYDAEGNLVKQSNGLEFYYDFEGIAACKYNGNTYIYITDGLGNVIALIDSNGNEVVQYWYDAWGNHKVVNSSGVEITDQNHIGNLNPFRYRGYYFDRETGLYFLQTRYYDPEIGRFLNRDSVNYADPGTINGLNLYAYCLNNPIAYTDPYGTTEWWEWLLGAGIMIAAIGLSFITAGLATPLTTALGGSLAASFAAGAITGIASGAISAVGLNVGSQIISNGVDNINWSQVGHDTLNGGIAGGFAGGAFNGLKYLFQANQVASNISGLFAAQDKYNQAAFILQTTPLIYRGGVKTTERIVAELSFETAKLNLSFAQSKYNIIEFISKNVLRSTRLILKRIIGDLIG